MLIRQHMAALPDDSLFHGDPCQLKENSQQQVVFAPNAALSQQSAARAAHVVANGLPRRSPPIRCRTDNPC
jgi:hypothetical protein